MIIQLTQPSDKGDPVWINLDHVITVNRDERGSRLGLVSGKEITVAETPEEIGVKQRRGAGMS